MNEFLASFSAYFPWIVLLIIVLVFRPSLLGMIEAIRKRISSSEKFKISATPWFSMLTTNTSSARRRERSAGGDLKELGNPDQLKVLFKAQGSDWMKSTKALDVPGGCLVQMTTEHLGRDGSWAVSEALEFVPGVRATTGNNDTYVLEAMSP